MDCGECITMFAKAGGCECMRGNCENSSPFIPVGCDRCGNKAAEYCFTSNQDTSMYIIHPINLKPGALALRLNWEKNSLNV